MNEASPATEVLDSVNSLSTRKAEIHRRSLRFRHLQLDFLICYITASKEQSRLRLHLGIVIDPRVLVGAIHFDTILDHGLPHSNPYLKLTS